VGLRVIVSVTLAGLAATVLPSGAAAGGAPSPARPAPAAVLVALWHMDETSGAVMADSVGGHNGTISGVELGLPGFIGTAYGFRRGVASVPSAKALNPGRRKLTLAIRMNTTVAPIRPDWDLMRKGVFGSGIGDYKIEYQPTGQASCGFLGSTGSAELVAGPALDDGRWHTVQCVKTATSIRLVVDGRTFSKRARVGSISNHAPLVIGSRPGSEFFVGALDEAYVQVG
jgi:concanavalin A-like lectin/glucanase superfamily protein